MLFSDLSTEGLTSLGVRDSGDLYDSGGCVRPKKT